MTKFWMVFTVCVLGYIGINAWNDVWVGQEAVRVAIIMSVIITGLIMWNCAGKGK